MDKVLQIVSLISTLVPQLFGLVEQAVQAATTNDQATLDALHAQALAAANAFAPAGETPLS